MQNRIGNTKIIALIIFILSVSITLGAGYYKTSLAAESAKFQGELTNLHNKPAVIDMGQQGAPKRFVQPDWVSLSTGHGKSGIKNASKDPLYLQWHMRFLWAWLQFAHCCSDGRNAFYDETKI